MTVVEFKPKKAPHSRVVVVAFEVTDGYTEEEFSEELCQALCECPKSLVYDLRIREWGDLKPIYGEDSIL